MKKFCKCLYGRNSGRYFRKKSGFTLVEVLIVVLVIAILSVSAITSYMSSSKTLTFLSNYRNFISVVRSPRSYAINNKVIQNVVVPRYGVYISDDQTNAIGEKFKEIVVFADIGTNAYVYDAVGSDSLDHEMSRIEIKNDKYVLTAYDSSGEAGPLTFPILLFYESGSGEFSALIEQDGAFLNKATHKFLAFKLAHANDVDLAKFLIIFQVSGLAEESNNLL